ncbi:MAG TPA: hypothetical protein VN132_11280 [Bdellovibrio sp.]|nr:hypothetical protein [Bdellovibrio sp.]
MKKIIFVLLLASSFLISARSYADETNNNNEIRGELGDGKDSNKSVSSWAFSLSSLQWNETLVLRQPGKSDTDVANFSGLALGLQKEITYYHWGWNIGGFFGSGRANGGGNSTSIPYVQSRQSFSIFGLTPRAFYRLSGRINVGVSALAYLRNIDWPAANAGTTVEASKNFTVTALADLNLRISNSFEFYQGIGPLSDSGTFWKIGLNYRF